MTTSLTDAERRRDWRRPSVLLATWGGLGFSPRAPGTMGSLGALPLVWACASLPLWVVLSLLLGLFVLGTLAAQRLEDRWGGHDHGAIVVDEVVGQWLAIALPLGLAPDALPLWWVFGLGFALFRFFDILKPPPVGWVDRRVAGGLGVMLDDVLAGVLAASVLLIIGRV